MRIRKASRLKYGQTPWDLLTKEELLLMVCRYHQALSSTASCLRQFRIGAENPAFFSLEGSGGIALALVEFLEKLCGDDKYVGSERIYRSFFRSTYALLFPGVEVGNWKKWWICETCGNMSASKTPPALKTCRCAGAWRPFRMADIRPDLEAKP
jgi:hypothetical protein